MQIPEKSFWHIADAIETLVIIILFSLCLEHENRGPIWFLFACVCLPHISVSSTGLCPLERFHSQRKMWKIRHGHSE